MTAYMLYKDVINMNDTNSTELPETLYGRLDMVWDCVIRAMVAPPRERDAALAEAARLCERMLAYDREMEMARLAREMVALSEMGGSGREAREAPELSGSGREAREAPEMGGSGRQGAEASEGTGGSI